MAVERLTGAWEKPAHLRAHEYRCGYCDRDVASALGFYTHGGYTQSFLYICPSCNRPTFFDEVQRQLPGLRQGAPVASVPADVAKLYGEAREADAAGAYTAAVLVLRKLLMHVAVERGAAEGESFQAYVQFFASKNLVPATATEWVDHIRTRGNEANHEIRIMNRDDAKDLLVFTEMLLKLVYEFPRRLPPRTK